MSSFSYEDLVLSSQFERVMKAPSLSRSNSQSSTQSTAPSTSSTRPHYLAISPPPRLSSTQPIPTLQPPSHHQHHVEPMTARAFDQFMELPEQPTRARSQTVQPSSINPSAHAANAAAHAHFLQYGHHPAPPGGGHRRSTQSIAQANHFTIISNHPAIQSRLQVIWYTLVAHSSNNQSINPPNQPVNPMTAEYCQYDDFHRFYVRLTGVLLTPHYHAGLTQANSEADWLSISKLHNLDPALVNQTNNQSGNSPHSQSRSIRILHRDRFVRWLFDATSMYVHLTDCAQFVFTFNKIYRGLTRFDGSGGNAVPVSFAAMNELPLVPMNDWSHTVQDCELYMRAVCERCQWPLNNDGIDFSMPLLPMMRVEKITEPMAQSAIRAIRAGEAHFGVCQGPNREGLAFSIAAMPPGFDALTEIAGLGTHLPDFWSPRHTLTRMNSTPDHLDINDSSSSRTKLSSDDEYKQVSTMDQDMEDQSSEWVPQFRDRARSMLTPPNQNNHVTIVPIARRPSMPSAHRNVNGPIQPKWISHR